MNIEIFELECPIQKRKNTSYAIVTIQRDDLPEFNNAIRRISEVRGWR